MADKYRRSQSSDEQSREVRKKKKRRKQSEAEKNRVYKTVDEKTSCIVRAAVKICSSKWFDNFILSLIVISSTCMAFDDPRLSKEHTKQVILLYLNLFFTFCFVLEMTAKHVAMGVNNYWK